MALTENQLALTKLYLASFNRAPETSGLNFWSAQLAAGKSLANVVDTVFSLPVVQAIYPASMSNEAFLGAIYKNIFGKTADAEGLAFWTKQLGAGQDRSLLVMTMIDAGLGSPDGTPGKAFVANRLESAKLAVEKQLAQGVEIALAKLVEIMSSVNADASSVTAAATKLDQYSGAKINGIVADGYIKNATVFADTNGDGAWNEGEAKTTTDTSGNFTLTNAKGDIVVTGGTDISTNLAHTGVLKAPEGSKVINPLTALQHAFVQRGKTAEEAQAAVIKALGLDSRVSLQDYDPLATAFSTTTTATEKAAAVQFQAAAAKVQNLLVASSKTLVGAAGTGATAADATSAVLASLAGNIAKDADGVVSLTDTGLLKAILADSAANSGNAAIKAVAGTVSNMANNFAAILSESAAKVDSVVSRNGSNSLLAIGQMAQVQTATQGTVADQMLTAARSGSLTNVVSNATGSALTSLVNNSRIGDLDPSSTTDSSVIGTVNGSGASSGGGGGTAPIDTTAPTVISLSRAGKILIIAADAGSTLTILDGNTNVTSKFDITEVSGIFTAVAKAGEFTGNDLLILSARATDSAGNVGAVFATPVTGYIDTTAPTVTSLSQAGKTLTIVAEAGSRLTILDGNTNVTSKFDITDDDGIFTVVARDDEFTGMESLILSARSTDFAGNAGAVFATPVTAAIDTTAPRLSGSGIVLDVTRGGDSAHLDSGDTVTFNFAEQVNTLGVVGGTAGFNTGTLSGDGMSVTFTLAGSEAANSTITLTGVQDAAGNTSSLIYAL